MKIIDTQSNMTAGELSPDMHSRIDVGVYYNGLSKAENVLIMPHGGVRRRPGLTKIQDSFLPGKGRMFSFEFSVTQDYLIVIIHKKLKVYRNGRFQAEISVPYTEAEIADIDVAQSGDVMIITHGNHHPRMLRREGSSTKWAIRNLPFVHIPTYDFGYGKEPVWSAKRGYPSVCTFFQSRLWLAGSPSNPNSIWGSKINGYYDFDIGTGQPDFGIFDTIDTEQFNRIVNIYAGRNLQVFTTGSEFYNTAEFITPESSVYKRSTSFGSKRIRPIMIEGAVLFTDRIGRTVRESVFEFQENAYVAPSVSVLSNHLIKNVVSMDAIKGTNVDVSDFLWIVNADGTIAVMNTSRLSDSRGWTQWTTQGNFKDVCVVNNIVYFMVERFGEMYIEYMNEGTVLDHNSVVLGSPKTTNNIIQTPNNISFHSKNIVYSKPGTGIKLDFLDTHESTTIASKAHRVILDWAIQQDQLGGIMKFPRPAYRIEVGFDVPLRVSTMPLNKALQQGDTLNEIKRVIKINLDLKDTLGVQGSKRETPDHTFNVVLDNQEDLFTGLKEVYLLGYDKQVIVDLIQTNPLPFKLLSIGIKQEIK